MIRDEKRARKAAIAALPPAEQRARRDAMWDQARRDAAERHPWLTSQLFTGLNIRVRDGQVYKYPTFGQAALGPLQGARAEITDPTKAQMVRAALMSGAALGSLLGPLALAPGVLRKSKAVAFVVLANGAVHERKLDGTAAIRRAQRDVVKFNVLSGAASQRTPEPPQLQPAVPTPAERLAEATRLHDQGLLTDEEYQAKRAEIISQL